MKEQIIYYGAPGTGKSYKISEKLKSVSNNKIFRVTIHPDFTYSDFVGQLLPLKSGTSITFEFYEGIFTKALKEAYADASCDVYLVIEELSRGNASGIFGDIFQLLDRDDYFVSRYPIKNENISSRIPELIADEVKLPTNFNILCSINTNDQNVFPMDTAFKRRFEWEYVSTCPIKDEFGNVLTKLNNACIGFIGSDGTLKETSWLNFYMSLNEFITDKVHGLGKNEDKQIGQFFIEFSKKTVEDSYSSNVSEKEVSIKRINELIKNKLLNYLWQDIQGTTYDSPNLLFSKDVNSFEFLFNNYEHGKIFSEMFLINFLEKNISRYSY